MARRTPPGKSDVSSRSTPRLARNIVIGRDGVYEPTARTLAALLAVADG
jgi:hypothetical protein